MPIPRAAIVSVLCALAAMCVLTRPADLRAASFDCAKAKSPAEKAVCADPALSTLDERLAAAYKAAMAGAPDRAAVKAAQFKWMREERDVCADKACLAAAYERRIASLQTPAAQAAAEAPPASGVKASPFAWLLDYAGKSTNSAVWDKRFKKTLEAVAPPFTKDLGMGKQETLTATLREFIGGPPDDVAVEDKRFVTLSACRAHSCPEKAWLWIDLERNAALGALVHYIYGDEAMTDAPQLLLFSKQLEPGQAPDNALRRLDAWLKDNGLVVTTRRYVGPSGELAPKSP